MSNRIDDGFSTTVAFADAPGIKLYEKDITPPGVDGGGPNDTTTMRNTAWRTKSPKKLKTLDQIVFTAAYATDVYPTLVAQVNNNQLITVTFADGSTLAVWVWLDKFKPNPVKEGEQPTASCTVEISNQDDDGDEVAPVYSEP